MNLSELEASLAGGEVRGAYLLLGGEPLLRDDALRALLGALLPDAARDFNLDRFDGAGGSCTSPRSLWHHRIRIVREHGVRETISERKRDIRVRRGDGSGCLVREFRPEQTAR